MAWGVPFLADLTVLQIAIRYVEENLMAKSKATTSRPSSSALMVRLDDESKAVLRRAAELRRISVSDYVRQVTLGQALKEVVAAGERTIALTPEEQLAFWNALNKPDRMTPAQKSLGKIMRGES